MNKNYEIVKLFEITKLTEKLPKNKSRVILFRINNKKKTIKNMSIVITNFQEADNDLNLVENKYKISFLKDNGSLVDSGKVSDLYWITEKKFEKFILKSITARKRINWKI